ncbi:transposon Ty3-G Gag-Pol polyprotein [Elysia marginata]|uniref:Transposon Ty3-G Gag-Pol polyprotein n=1 Tax=Elysia marginata TaxID=1093978 RepID=A0AAV4IB57_9GAST|nr:transposon Ty3-G Gag-Pol polyprotein [Elysia marginata]
MYLYGSLDFTVTTDHKAPRGIIRSMTPYSARIETWRLGLMPYQFKLIIRPGKYEANSADYFSRHPHAKLTRDNEGERYIRYIANTSVPNVLSLDEVRKATSLDEHL